MMECAGSGLRTCPRLYNRWIVPASTLITADNLAKALHIPVDRIHALIDAGYICGFPIDKSKKIIKVVKSNPPEDIPDRVVDRISIVLWMLGLDKGYQPNFSLHVERRIMRIAKLPVVQRTEQAVKLIRRYRDAEAIVEAVSLARAGDVAMVEIKRQSAKHKLKMAILAGIDARSQDRAQAQAQAQARQAHDRSPASQRSRRGEHVESK
jgi:hypothetical protein